jgi:predicted dehydrogenase
MAGARSKISELSDSMGVSADVKYVLAGGDGYERVINKTAGPASVIVAVPDDMHKTFATASIKAGLHTLVVKPLVQNTKDLRDLLTLQEKKNVYCAVEFHKRFDDANLKLKDVIDQGAIGDPLYFLAEFSQRKSMPTKIFKKWACRTNIFQYLGMHYVDIVYFATGATPLRAMAVGQKNWLIRQGIDTYDSIEAIIEWKMPSGKKFTSCIITNWVDPESTSAMSDQKIKVVGTKGRFESDQKQRGLMIVTDDGGVQQPNPYFCAPYGKKGAISYAGYGIDSIHQFLDDVSSIEKGELSIKDLEGKRPTFRASLVPTAVLEAVNKSLRCKGSWVAIGLGKAK